MNIQDILPEKKQIRHSFGKASETYDQSAVLQREVSDRMASRLDLIKTVPKTILDAGAGTGYGFMDLRQRYSDSDLIALDLAIGMLQYTRQKLKLNQGFIKKWFGKKTDFYLTADIEKIPLQNNSIEMIWSNLAIQWCHTPDHAFSEFFRILKPNGLLMFSTLGPDTLKELRYATRKIDDRQHVNEFIDMHDLGDALVQSGFKNAVTDMDFITVSYKDVLTLMKDLKGIGAHNVAHGRHKGLTGKSFIKQVAEHYEFFRTAEGFLPATYEVIYGHAWKEEPKTLNYPNDPNKKVIPIQSI